MIVCISIWITYVRIYVQDACKPVKKRHTKWLNIIRIYCGVMSAAVSSISFCGGLHILWQWGTLLLTSHTKIYTPFSSTFFLYLLFYVHFRSPNTSQKLREWLFVTFNVNSEYLWSFRSKFSGWYFCNKIYIFTCRYAWTDIGSFKNTRRCLGMSCDFDILGQIFWVSIDINLQKNILSRDVNDGRLFFSATLTTNLQLTSLKVNPEISLYITEVSFFIFYQKIF